MRSWHLTNASESAQRTNPAGPASICGNMSGSVHRGGNEPGEPVTDDEMQAPKADPASSLTCLQNHETGSPGSSPWRPSACAAMRVHDTCLLEVREQAANDVCVVRPTKNPRKFAPWGSFFGQVLLSVKYDRPHGPELHNGSHVFVFCAYIDGRSQRGKIAMPIYPNITYPWVPRSLISSP